jgi:deoxyribodipyrimidine photolyase-related protein
MKRIIYIPFDHLNRSYGALRQADPKADLIALVESSRMTTGDRWHPERLFFMISSARHFASELSQDGFTQGGI